MAVTGAGVSELRAAQEAPEEAPEDAPEEALEEVLEEVLDAFPGEDPEEQAASANATSRPVAVMVGGLSMGSHSGQVFRDGSANVGTAGRILQRAR